MNMKQLQGNKISPEDTKLIQKIIDESQKKVLSPEAQCISNIFQNCIQQMEIAAALPALCHSDSVSGAVDQELQELIAALQAYKTLGERLQKLQDAEQEPHESQEDVGETKSRARDQLEREFKNSVRDLLRLFRTRPDLSSTTEFSTEAGESECRLINGLQAFQGYLIETLQKRPFEEFHLLFSKKSSSSRSHEYEHMVKLEEVAANIREIDEKILEKNKEISVWKRRIQVEDEKHADLKILVDKRCQLHITTSEMKQASIQQEIDQLKIQLNNLIFENQKTPHMLKEEKRKMELVLEYVLKHFDETMEALQVELDSVEKDTERELRLLEKDYAVLEVECNHIRKKRWLEEDRRMREMREKEVTTNAATVIQTWWRGHLARKASKAKAVKGKGKKKKKGKGKKKK